VRANFVGTFSIKQQNSVIPLKATIQSGNFFRSGFSLVRQRQFAYFA
jgi:hypothetical protein